MSIRSQVENWSIDHLDELASHYGAHANWWRFAFAKVAKEAHIPGGTDWLGVAGAAAQDYTQGLWDQAEAAASAADTLAVTARSGATAIHAAKQRTIEVVTNAEQTGFPVDENLIVHAPKGFERIGVGHQAAITSALTDLVKTDSEVATQVSTGVQAIDFTPVPTPPTPPEQAPPGKMWHYHDTWGWRLGPPLEHCSGEKKFWDGVGMAAGTVAIIFGGPLGAVGGFAGAGAAGADLGNCD